MRVLTAILLVLVVGTSSRKAGAQENRAGSRGEIVKQLQAPEAAQRREAVFVLSTFDDPTLSPIFQRAASDPDAGVRAMAITAPERLSRIDEASGIPDLLPTLLRALSDPHPLVRRVAAEALGRTRDPRIEKALEKATRDRDAAVRAAAVDALGELGTETVLPLLLERLHDQDPFVRRQAARALGRLGAPTATASLIERAIREKDSEVKRTIAWALGQIGDPRAIETLQALARSPDPYLSAIAGEALEKIRTR
jgi:HEAT repeat protein